MSKASGSSASAILYSTGGYKTYGIHYSGGKPLNWITAGSELSKTASNFKKIERKNTKLTTKVLNMF